MTARAIALAAACALSLLVTACGSDGKGGEGSNPADKRGAAFGCITKEKGLDARLDGEKAIAFEGADAPRVEFFVSTGEAEARQFQGEAQGAEQIGAALLYVRGASDEELERIEDCLHRQ